MKGNEIADAVAANIRKAVKHEVEVQLRPIKDTMLGLIDRVVALEARQQENFTEPVQDESNSNSGSERTETLAVQPDDQVVQESGLEGSDCCGKEGAESPTRRGLLS